MLIIKIRFVIFMIIMMKNIFFLWNDVVLTFMFWFCFLSYSMERLPSFMLVKGLAGKGRTKGG